MKEIQRIRIINGGDDDNMYENTEAAKDVIYDLVTSNENVCFHTADFTDGTLTLEVI